MMVQRPTVELKVGERIIAPRGPAVVVEIGRHGVVVEHGLGQREFIRSDKLIAAPEGGSFDAIDVALEPWWSSLDDETREDVLFKLEVVLEILTGYRLGFAYLALPGEPFEPFGESFRASLTKRAEAMARQISFERSVDRKRLRRVQAGELASTQIKARTIQNWVNALLQRGLRGLVDGRKTRQIQGFDKLEPTYVRLVDEEVSRFTGEESAVRHDEVERRVLERLWKEHGLTDDHLPQRLAREYLSVRMNQLGRGTRAHKSRAHRRVASKSSYAALHPGHLTTDFTRVDGFAVDEITGDPIPVECQTYMSMSSRVVLSLRIAPLGARALDAALGLFDALRPQSMVVDGTTLSDFRWCGVPDSIEWGTVPTAGRKRLVSGPQTIDGEHHLPGVAPASLRTDNGSTYRSKDFRAVLHHWGIDHYPSRGRKPNDNPQQERAWDSWIQAALQAIPGYKGRCVYERGSVIIKSDTPLWPWYKLETYLRRWVALEYHRKPHDGLVLPKNRKANVTPLAYHDHLMELCGRITVPQHPDLIFDFLPVVWLTPGHAGVKHARLWYDGDILEETRAVRPRTYRARDDKVPFIFDPRDASVIWHRSREDGRIHELRMRHAHVLDQPLNQYLHDLAVQQIRASGGNGAISRRRVKRDIITALGSIADTIDDAAERRRLSAAHIRWEQAQLDHSEVLAARATVAPDRTNVHPLPRRGAPASPDAGEPSMWVDEWPELPEEAR